MEILQYPLDAVPEALAAASDALERATWPEAFVTENGEPPVFPPKPKGSQAFFTMDEQLVGYAEIFPRTVFTEKGPLEVWGLGSVCVDESRRGAGIGRKVVEACFAQIDLIENGVSLFQTQVPGFYEKLNCQRVNNLFTNGKNLENPNKNPFWDEFTMVYPKDYPWPDGKIDLNGKGY